MVSIAHIVNPAKVSENTDLHKAQPVTFRSMLVAKQFCSQRESITLYTTQFEEDESIIPTDFIRLSNLQQSVLDVNKTLSGKRLPLIKDVLQKLNEVDADYCIYTNMDIALMPYFYDAVLDYISKGYDAIVINRRRISKQYFEQSLAEMYADFGKSHPGFDCFVFKKSLLDKFMLGNICIGMPFVETTLVHNIATFSENPLYVADKHLTFHIGMEVMPKRNHNFYWHNRHEFFKNIYPNMKQHFSLKKFPYASLPFHQRALKWILNPSIFTRNYFALESKNVLNEIRWRMLQK